MSPAASLQGLPGAELILQGIADAQMGKLTVFTCLLGIAMPTLEQGGVITGDWDITLCQDPELTMYRLLRAEAGDAYSRYNALLRRLVSFQQALRKRR